jgi:hypothetical protein
MNDTSSSCWEAPSWELSPSLDPTWDCVWDGEHRSLQLYSTRSLEWMSRRSRNGDDDHENGSLRSSLGNHKTWRSSPRHKPWSSSIERGIFRNIVKSHPKITFSVSQVEDRVCPDLSRHIPTVSMVTSVLFQEYVRYFTVYMIMLEDTPIRE